MAIHCNHREWTGEFMVDFVNMLVKVFSVHQSVNIVECHFMEAAVDTKFINENGKARNISDFFKHVIRRKVLHHEDQRSKKQRPDDVLIDDEQTE